MAKEWRTVTKRNKIGKEVQRTSRGAWDEKRKQVAFFNHQLERMNKAPNKIPPKNEE